MYLCTAKTKVLPTQPQTFRPASMEDSASALHRHWLSMDEVPAVFSKNPEFTNDSALIRQMDVADYSINGRFLSHAKIEKPLTGKQPENGSDFWFVGLLVLPILISLLIVKSSFSRIQGAYKALFNNRFASIFIRNFTIGNQFSTYLIIFNTTLSLSVGIWLRMLQTQRVESETQYKILLIILLIVAGYFLYRYLVVFLAKIIFETDESTEQYLYRDYYVNAVAATILPFIIFAAAFAPIPAILWFITAGIISLLLIYRVLLFIYIGILERTYGGFYFILYFCTVEILPVVFLVKILTERISA